MTVYNQLAQICAKIDRRSTRYRFDLDKDIAWDRLAEPGDYFTSKMVRELNVRVDVLEANPAAHALFQWAMALSSCRSFIELEDDIVRVVANSPEEFKGSLSVTYLSDEEVKHIALFERYAQHLEAQRPELVTRFNELFARCRYVQTIGQSLPLPDKAEFLLAIQQPVGFPKKAEDHYFFWLGSLFFEEYTIYLHERLSEEAASMQPAWLTAHAAHRQEIQHVVTDAALIQSLAMSPKQRRDCGTLAILGLAKTHPYILGTHAAVTLVAEHFPELPPLMSDEPFLTSGLGNAIRTCKAFAHFRALPGLEFLQG